LIYTHSINGLI